MLPILRNDHPTLAPIATAPINRFEALFDRVFGDDGGSMNQVLSWAPVAMWEDDDRICIEVDLPGVAENDVDLTVHDGMLFVRGVRRAEEGRRYLYNGRSYGRFERVIALPEAVTTDDVHATLTNGVLRIDLPKSPEAKPKKIALKTT